jgi:hypothetical protein
MLCGARIVMIPDRAEIGTVVPSTAAPTTLMSWTTVGPVAVADNVTFTVATVPLGIVVVFIPHTMHRKPAQARDLPADVAVAPTVALMATTFDGTLKSHCSAAGWIVEEGVNDSCRLTVAPGVAAVDESCSEGPVCAKINPADEHKKRHDPIPMFTSQISDVKLENLRGNTSITSSLMIGPADPKGPPERPFRGVRQWRPRHCAVQLRQFESKRRSNVEEMLLTVISRRRESRNVRRSSPAEDGRIDCP